MDYLVKAIAYDGKIRAYAARTTETIHEAQKRHNTWPTASAALGRTMTAAVMLGAMLKGEDKLTVKIEGAGRSEPSSPMQTQRETSGDMCQIRTFILI